MPKNSSALRSKAKRKGRRVRLRASNVRTTQNLGNGFRRVEFNPVTIGARSFLTLILSAGSGRAVINGGWTISEFASAWPTDSFPLSDTEWVIILENPTGVVREVIPFLITKSLR
ncbi:hypothetical protein [Paenibacillus tengchongensis]|uniref:hypothetical protein n=1 Tax=Paenibacillus tengchongensis TaxID=2608684 RepID=UPI00124EF87D|nr:hypothetical protein [Paenibacillus tengchongensis]